MIVHYSHLYYNWFVTDFRKIIEKYLIKNRVLSLWEPFRYFFNLFWPRTVTIVQQYFNIKHNDFHILVDTGYWIPSQCVDAKYSNVSQRTV